MGCWLIAKSRIVGLRDGRTAADPLKSIGPAAPVWFDNLNADDLRWDGDVLVVDEPPPGKIEKLITKVRGKDRA